MNILRWDKNYLKMRKKTIMRQNVFVVYFLSSLFWRGSISDRYCFQPSGDDQDQFPPLMVSICI